MIELQIVRAGPTGTGEFQKEVVAELHVDGRDYRVEGDRGVLGLDQELLNLRDGSRIAFNDDPEEWARSLPGRLRGPNLAAVVVDDTNPIPDPEDDEERVVVRHRVGGGARRT